MFDSSVASSLVVDAVGVTALGIGAWPDCWPTAGGAAIAAAVSAGNCDAAMFCLWFADDRAAFAALFSAGRELSASRAAAIGSLLGAKNPGCLSTGAEAATGFAAGDDCS